MSSEPTIYDLVLLLSMEASEEERAKILADVESAIASAGGTLHRNIDWGRRAMTFQIRHQPEAEYHLLQFSGPPSLLEALGHTLGITAEVLRFRIIKVIPGTPAVADHAPPVLAGAPAGGSTAADGDE
jgi:small subunit ribosomal protein S6